MLSKRSSLRVLVVWASVAVFWSGLVVGQYLLMTGAGIADAQGGGVPSGGIIFVDAGSCPSGFTELATGDGRDVLMTVAANSNVGTTGGSSTSSSVSGGTPAGTMSGSTATEATHTHSVTSNVSVDNHASHTHDYTQVLNHTHTININDPGHTHVENNNSATTGPNVGWGAQDTSTNTSSTTGYSTASATTGITGSSNNPSGGVATGTSAGPSATLTHTTNNPAVTSGAGASHSHAVGSLAFTGSALSGHTHTTTEPFLRLIGCKAD